MIFPLPAVILDALIVVSIAVSLILLLASLYSSEPDKFTALPTMLLICTVFRLSLNIATTRTILGSSEVPDVVIAFGTYVVQGDVALGLVVFAILSIVQFMVIAKGAERVAEVAARFTLDAMPGKQMAIDADLRSGIIPLSEARARRLELQKESKLYGALDGAMKFIKGDAVAGIMITFVNITAGLLIGMLRHDIGFGAAVEKYVILTVGDGLMTQIPALFTSLAAGIAVTRVSDPDGTFFGRELFDQLSAQPATLGTAALILGGFALAPGLPTLPFLFAASGIGTIAIRRGLAKEKDAEITEAVEFRPRAPGQTMVRMTPELIARLQQRGDFTSRVKEVRSAIYNRLGIVLGEIALDIAPAAEDACSDYEVLIKGVRVFAGSAPTTNEELSSNILTALTDVLIDYREDLIDDTHTRILLDLNQPLCEDLITFLIPKQISVTELTALMRQLVRERVSIRSVSTILQSVAEHYVHGIKQTALKNSVKTVGDLAGNDSNLDLLADVRRGLSRQICTAAADRTTILAITLNPEIDHLLTKCCLLQIDPALKIIEGLLSEIRQYHEHHRTLTIICTRYSRKLLADLLIDDGIGAYVLSGEELSREFTLSLVGELGAGGLEGGASFARSELEQ
jgi:type III secretion protein V